MISLQIDFNYDDQLRLIKTLANPDYQTICHIEYLIIRKIDIVVKKNNRSLSGIIESFLQSLILRAEKEEDKDAIDISPFVKSISSGVHLPADLDYKAGYSNFLTDKYK